MATYKCFYNQKTAEVTASSQYQAKLKAIKLFKVRKSQQHMVTVMLLEENGEPVVHLPLF